MADTATEALRRLHQLSRAIHNVHTAAESVAETVARMHAENARLAENEARLVAELATVKGGSHA